MNISTFMNIIKVKKSKNKDYVLLFPFFLFQKINETLFSKERHILKINQQQFVNLYQLNIKHKKVHSIPYTYIPIEEINILNLDVDLFVINTGGDNIPTNEQYQIAKKIMKERFPKATKYEIINDDNNK